MNASTTMEVVNIFATIRSEDTTAHAQQDKVSVKMAEHVELSAILVIMLSLMKLA